MARNSKYLENTTFRKMGLFPSSDEEEVDPYSAGSFRKS
jgi:hypothetical protein